MATAEQSQNAPLDDLSKILGSDAHALLDPAVARAWIAFLTAYGRVTRALSSELMDTSGMSLADFDVMAQLVRSEEYRLRMSELADAALISKSGLTRRIDRPQHFAGCAVIGAEAAIKMACKNHAGDRADGGRNGGIWRQAGGLCSLSGGPGCDAGISSPYGDDWRDCHCLCVIAHPTLRT